MLATIVPARATIPDAARFLGVCEMGKKAKASDKAESGGYKETLRHLQIELVKLQRHLIKNDLQVLILFEGRDAAGKDGVIKRITQHLSPRETRVVALGKPSDRDRHSWYFQRYVSHLPSIQEMVLMNRSWYNRTGVERVMGYCSELEHEEFMRSVLPFEHMLVGAGMQLFKYYLDISKEEQKRRLEDRRINPLKQWKVSPIDKVAIEHWDDYSAARNEMFERTHNETTPWYVVRADNKKRARLNVIRHLMSLVDCPDKDEHAANPDPEIVFTYNDRHLESGAIAE
jgi:polyphosphate kinase